MRRHMQSRLVPDPMMTDAEFLHRQSQERERANTVNTKPDLNVGKVWVTENAMARIGALCFIRPPRRQDHHVRAAEEFKNLYEGRYGLGGSAVDASRVQVDTSPTAHDSGMANKIDRTVKLGQAMSLMPKHLLDRVVACVILGISCEDQAETTPSGQPNKRQVARCVETTLDALDTLAILWGYKTGAA